MAAAAERSPESEAAEEAARTLLVDEDEAWFTPVAERMFREVFRRFDRDGDDAWNEAELQLFAAAVNGKPFTDIEVADLREAVDHNDAGALTEAGFLQFYTLHCQMAPLETVSDLEKLGFPRAALEAADAPAADGEAADGEGRGV